MHSYAMQIYADLCSIQCYSCALHQAIDLASAEICRSPQGEKKICTSRWLKSAEDGQKHLQFD